MSTYNNDSQPPKKGPGRPRKISQTLQSSKSSTNSEDSSQPRKRLRISFKNDKINEPLEEFRNKLIYERVDELSKLVNKHDLLLRELHFHESNKPLEDFDPEKIKHDNSIPIEKVSTIYLFIFILFFYARIDLIRFSLVNYYLLQLKYK